MGFRVNRESAGYPCRPSVDGADRLRKRDAANNWLSLVLSRLPSISMVRVFGLEILRMLPNRLASTRTDRKLYRKRLNIGLEQLQKLNTVDTSRLGPSDTALAAPGFWSWREAAQMFRGLSVSMCGLDSPEPEAGKNIKCSILVCHGADDPLSPPKTLKRSKLS